MPLYASVTGMLAWGLVETGALERAEEAGMAALHMDARVRGRGGKGRKRRPNHPLPVRAGGLGAAGLRACLLPCRPRH